MGGAIAASAIIAIRTIKRGGNTSLPPKRHLRTGSLRGLCSLVLQSARFEGGLVSAANRDGSRLQCLG